MDRFAMDVRLAARSLYKRPVLTFTIVATLALGIGANAAIFGVIDRLAFRPFEIPDVDRIVMPALMGPTDRYTRETVSAANFFDWRRDLDGGSIHELAAFAWWDANLIDRGEPEHAIGFRVSPAFFAVMGVAPALGRGFGPDSETVGRDRELVLADGLWRRRFGADPGVVGRTVLVDGLPSEVVGVMPAGFDFPYGAEIWAPLSFDLKTPPRRTGGGLTVLGRLTAGKTLADAQAEMSVIAARLRRDFPRENKDRDVRVHTLVVGMRDEGLEEILSLQQGAALFVLLIACANIANLLLARGSERAREIAVRLALGSSRGRIVRDTMLETILLAMCAVPLSLLVTAGFLGALRALMPARLLRFVAGWEHMGVDLRVTAMAALLGVATALVCGALPALQLSRGRVAEALKSSGRTASASRRERWRRGLVIVEIALVLPLLVATALSVRSVSTYLSGRKGFDSSSLLVFKVGLPQTRYPDAESRRRYTGAALSALAEGSGTGRVAAASALPSSGANRWQRIEIEGQQTPQSGELPTVFDRSVSDTYFDVLRLPVHAGRGFTSADRAATQPVAVISESMARKFWPGGGALGSHLRIGGQPWLTVVGICGDIVDDIDRRGMPTMYRPLTQAPGTIVMFAVRTEGDPLALVGGVNRSLARVDATLPAFDVMSMTQMLSLRSTGIRIIAGLVGTFAGLAFVLAVLGLYAVMSCLVAQRVREIGVRIALGATRSDITRLALGQAVRLTGLGVGVGLGLAVVLGRAMAAGLLGVVSSDLATPFATAVVLSIAALVSSYIPARRAASVDPIVALRSE